MRGVTFIAGVWEVWRPASEFDPAELVDVPALFIDGVDEPVWVGDTETYWDRWGDGGTSAQEVIADAIRGLLMPDGLPSKQRPKMDPLVESVAAVLLDGARSPGDGKCDAHGVTWPCFTCVKEMEAIR